MFYYFLYLSFLSVRNAEFLISKVHNLRIDIKESENLYEKYDKCYIKEKQQSLWITERFQLSLNVGQEIFPRGGNTHTASDK